mmetsp:Transcript_5462/g.18811  ORF Transcript_5462/g.18811 Transcript_5462/m.18811 type:complete len:491 (-) Transcript_5462:2930-4402(-)
MVQATAQVLVWALAAERVWLAWRSWARARDTRRRRKEQTPARSTAFGEAEQTISGAPDDVFDQLLREAKEMAAIEPALVCMLKDDLLQHASLEEALAFSLSRKLTGSLCHDAWHKVFREMYCSTAPVPGPAPDPEDAKRTVVTLPALGRSLGELARRDLLAVRERDPACERLANVLLFFKGFQALQCQRVAHALWYSGREQLALAIQSTVSEVMGLDIHPQARIGAGVMFDHGTGIVIGATAILGDNCTLLHGVTLGASGKVSGDRHPKVGCDCLIGAQTTVLGNIEVGDGAKIGASSVVLKAIPPKATAVGVPAKVIGRTIEAKPGKLVDHGLQNVQSFRRVTEATPATGTPVISSVAGAAEAAAASSVAAAPSSAASAAATKKLRAIKWDDVWDPSKDGAGITREQMRGVLAKFGATEAQSDAVFFRLDENLDNVVSEQEFKAKWQAAVAAVCPGTMCPGLKVALSVLTAAKSTFNLNTSTTSATAKA